MIKIAVTNLGKYNEGELIFTWLELPATEEEIQAAKNQIGINEEYEEWFITDYETPSGLKIGEYDSLTFINEIAERLGKLADKHGLDFEDILEGLLYSYDSDIMGCIVAFENGNFLYFSDVKNDYDLGVELVDNGFFDRVPDHLKNYLDYEAIGRDESMNGTFTSNGYIEVR